MPRLRLLPAQGRLPIDALVSYVVRADPGDGVLNARPTIEANRGVIDLGERLGENDGAPAIATKPSGRHGRPRLLPALADARAAHRSRR